MDSHQRRIFTQMLDQVDLYCAGQVTLDLSVNNLGGPLGAADIHDKNAINAFHNHLAPVKLQLELQGWTPREPVSPADLDAAVEGYREWALAMLEDPDEALL